MSHWEHFIQVAQLGTARKSFQTEGYPNGIQSVMNKILTDDKEESFLNLASVYSVYYHAGIQFSNLESEAIPVCEDETKNYVSDQAMKVLSDILYWDTEDQKEMFLELWLSIIQSRNELIQPQMLVELFQKYHQKSLFSKIVAAGGKRAHWLIELNADWQKKVILENEDDIWETGKQADRIEILRKWRTENPSLALEKLQAVWSKEPAAFKSLAIHCLVKNLSSADITFLESCLKEKSKEVKSTAASFLLKIPETAIAKKNLDFVVSSFVYKKPGLIGSTFGKKPSLERMKVNPDPQLFDYGFEKVNPTKGGSDEDYWLEQALEHVSLEQLLKSYQLKASEIVQVFAGKGQEIFLNALFRRLYYRTFETEQNNAEWVEAFYEHGYFKEENILNFSTKDQMAWLQKLLETGRNLENTDYLKVSVWIAQHLSEEISNTLALLLFEKANQYINYYSIDKLTTAIPSSLIKFESEINLNERAKERLMKNLEMKQKIMELK